MIDFLFSERGEFIRFRLADELVKILDALGQAAFDQTITLLRIQSPLPRQSAAVSDPQMRDSLKRIWILLQESPGFELERLMRAVTKILAKPEAQQTGRYVAGRLLQRGIARLIYTVMPPPPQTVPQQRTIPKALPAASN